MNATQKLLANFAVLFFVFAAALLGCGGGDESDPTVMNTPVQPSKDGGDAAVSDAPGQDTAPDVLPDSNDPETACVTSLGAFCAEEDAVDPCTGYVCHCGKWEDPDSTTSNKPCIPGDAGEDAEQDAGADADTDAEADVEVDAPLDSPEDVQIDGPDDTNIDSPEETGTDADTGTPVEICNGLDDDGVNGPDDTFACVLGSLPVNCTASCGSTGTKSCLSDCSYSTCQPPTEVCNGLDDDCVSGADNGFACVQGSPSVSCTTSCGSTGTKTCLADCSFSTCQPPQEVCSGANDTTDEDCDGKAGCDDPNCAGMAFCNPTEICNGLDDDGVNGPDDIFECVQGSSAVSCTTVCNTTGSQACQNDCSYASCQPPTEVCNGQDDDCVSGIDNGFECPLNSAPVDCATSCGSIGSKACGSNCSYGQCMPPVEVCNGLDDDCVNGPDNGFECIKNSGSVNCVTSCGSTGSKTCGTNCAYGTCQAPAEVCNGLDDDCVSGADNGFECIKNSAPVSCTTTCGSTGTKACNSNCSYDACQAPAEVCNNGPDDDCDGKADCEDTDCASAPNCQHNFGTCDPLVPTNVPYTCGTWQQDTVPSSIFMITAGCANSLTDQWAVGGTYQEVKAVHLTGGTTWADVPLPTPGKPNYAQPDILCLGANQVYMLYNAYENYVKNGVLLRWNGSQWTRLAEATLQGKIVQALWGTSPTDIRFVARDASNYANYWLYTWNGSTLTTLALPSYGTGYPFWAEKMWGSSGTNVYAAGVEYDINDQSNYDKRRGAMIHWDGSSWAKVQVPYEIREFYSLHGSSSCDVMAVGNDRTSPTVRGATFQRNGMTWDVRTYADLDHVRSVVKVDPFKYVLQGHQPQALDPLIGTDLGNFQVQWSEDFAYLATGSKLYHGTAVWQVPGTNVVMNGGDGYHANGDPSGVGDYAYVLRSTCQ